MVSLRASAVAVFMAGDKDQQSANHDRKYRHFSDKKRFEFC
jgi:hypothetical protein